MWGKTQENQGNGSSKPENKIKTDSDNQGFQRYL